MKRRVVHMVSAFPFYTPLVLYKETKQKKDSRKQKNKKEMREERGSEVDWRRERKFK